LAVGQLAKYLYFIDPAEGVLSVMDFHEKAGWSQVGSFVFSLVKLFSPAESPLSPPFHPHSSMSDFVSLGASWVFSFQPVLPPDYRPHRNSALGFCLSFLRMFWLYATAAIAAWVAVAQRLVGFSAHPQPMQQNR
jgi:hypothetical protein